MGEIKVVVTSMPTTSKECPFSEYIGMTSKYKCQFQGGLYSRCNLDCGKECEYLVSREAEGDIEPWRL